MSKFLKVIVNLFLVCAILVAGALLIPPVLGISTTMIDSSSMDTNLPVGSVTYSQEVSVADISVGDQILVESDVKAYAYIVDSADAGAGKYIGTSVSDPQAEPEEIAVRNVALKIIITIPLIGYVMIAMRSTEGLIIIGLVVLFVIILFILSELWKKTEDDDDDYDDYEDDDEYEDEPVRVAVPQKRQKPSEPEEEYHEPTTALTDNELAQAIAEIKNDEDADPVVEEFSSVKEEVPLDCSDIEKEIVSTDRNSFVPVKRPSKEDILKKSQAAGEKPVVIEQDGITLIDYSDLL